MLELDTVDQLVSHVGQSLGTGDWLAIDQTRIDAFAQATGDMQWIHVDAGRAARDMPGGKTIAHGCLTLSLLAALSTSVWRLRRVTRGLNYGYDRVRFLTPVPCGARIRLEQTLESFEPVAGGARLTLKCTVQIDGTEKPAMVATQVLLYFN